MTSTPSLDPNVQAILDEINKQHPSSSTTTTTQKELRAETKQFLHTAQEYLECRKQMDAKYAEIDPDSTIANLDIQTDSGGIISDQTGTDNQMAYKKEYQQQSLNGAPVTKLTELYDAATAAQQVYQEVVQQLVDKVTESCAHVAGVSEGKIGADTAGAKLQFAPLKGRERAQEKADDDYSDRVPGPGTSWLYDVVRGSVKFSTAEQIAKCLELIQADPTMHIVKAKNRFKNPTLTGYRDFNLCIRIDTQRGFHHVCEIQIHLGPIKQLSIDLSSHKHYEYFRSYFDGSTDSLAARLEDLQQIVQEHTETVIRTRSIDSNGVLDEGILQRLLDKGQNEDRIDRLADLFREYLCEYDWSLRAYAKLLNIRLRKHNGPNDAAVASTFKEMAQVLQHQRRLEDSISFFQQSLDIQKRVLGEDHLEVANTLSSMAAVLRFQGKIDEAMDVLQQGLTLKKQALGEEHISVANTYNTIGGVYFNKRELDKAMKYFQRSLEIYMNVIGEDHKFIANTFNNIALVLVDQAEYDKAMQQYKGCLDIQKRTLGEEHAVISTTYSNIGDVYVHKKDPDTALKYYEMSIEIKQKTLGEDHPSVANIYRNMVKALKQKGDMTQAMDLEAKAYRIEKAAKKSNR
ncbi:unnamed protein product [Cylindrotheca closterium]|uniref:Kinesin light chain n=1 Tax=Cylindrotheca closterium TaxID=2856 RepID=A0AAD2G6U9_9STRA|nr:unnamed protein product [Cylindrotheca closterium]